MNPKYSIGDIIYLRESASLGFLEAYKVTGITSTSPGRIVYYIDVSNGSPIVNFGERITNQNRPALYFDETELIAYCDALTMIRTYLTTQLTAVNSKLTQCETGTA